MNKLYKVGTAVLILFLIAVAGYDVWKGRAARKASAEAEASLELGPQETTVVGDGAFIRKELDAVPVVIIKDIEVCLPPGRPRYDEFQYVNSCNQKNCETQLTFKKDVPSSVSLYRKFNEECVPQTIDNLQKYLTGHYSSRILLSLETSKKMHIENKDIQIGRTPNSKFISPGYAQIGDNIVVTFEYNGPVEEDEFLFKSKVIHVTYGKPKKID
jgi:hypothetical protein